MATIKSIMYLIFFLLIVIFQNLSSFASSVSKFDEKTALRLVRWYALIHYPYMLDVDNHDKLSGMRFVMGSGSNMPTWNKCYSFSEKTTAINKIGRINDKGQTPLKVRISGTLDYSPDKDPNCRAWNGTSFNRQINTTKVFYYGRNEFDEPMILDAFGIRMFDDNEIKPNSKETFTDPRDGQVYKIVKIGNTTWLAQNLKYLMNGIRCYDDFGENCEKYGPLYTFNLAVQACPDGWRLPSIKDIEGLLEQYGGEIGLGREIGPDGATGLNVLLGGVCDREKCEGIETWEDEGVKGVGGFFADNNDDPNVVYIAAYFSDGKMRDFETTKLKKSRDDRFHTSVRCVKGTAGEKKPDSATDASRNLPSKAQSAKNQISLFEMALKTYRSDVGNYPTTNQGLVALRFKPENENGWRGPYFRRRIPLDPWGNSYEYTMPGYHGEFDILSFGADGKEGGAGENTDITNWETIKQ